jgi:mono/diheme cytochrome c family protein
MDTYSNAVLGMFFLFLAYASTFLMFKLWGYPFDKEKHKSSAPPALMLTHRMMGYAYLIIYLYFMSEMLPRLWNYQVEFPARTVAHLLLGMTIGVILICKIAIVKFFKYLESSMVPLLGISLLICTNLLIGLSVPFAFKESSLSGNISGGSAFSEENRTRVSRLLPTAGLPEEAVFDELATVENMEHGRNILLKQCVQCHDLRTILLRPRTPENWVKTVTRMAERSLLWNPINETDQWAVSTYLIAITPDLQRSAKQKRSGEVSRQQVQEAMETTAATLTSTGSTAELPPVDPVDAQQTFEATCSQCHEASDIEFAPPESEEDARSLVTRMVVENGLEETEENLEKVIYYLT